MSPPVTISGHRQKVRSVHWCSSTGLCVGIVRRLCWRGRGC
ncbi:hypothetical protein E1A91_A03G187500v1 [Gossypium mustelinum]|uniref:Uncharacterized protein n=1 Tax=Gossypium mustelinum TaxID=34275 RepID=A0A5D2ZZ29_GOSMU|nr:hypothetical protein E1A91_A03G187500v1 [Gossypium mustelinum]